MKWGLLILGIVIVSSVMVVSFYIVYSIQNFNGVAGEFLDIGGDEDKIDPNSKDAPDRFIDENGNPVGINVVGGGAGGGAGGGSSGESESSGTACTQDITYSTFGLFENETCNQMDLGVCVDKTVYCSINVENLDGRVGGIFTLNIFTYNSSDGRDFPLIIKSVSNNVPIGTIINFNESFNFLSSGASGVANQNIDCDYSTITIPQASC